MDKRPLVSELTLGDVVAERTFQLTRDNLVRYAGASGDFNPIHYRDDIAESVGLPGVLAHGMLTMGVAVQPVIDWLGDPGRIVDYQVRFTRPVVVDPLMGVTLKVSAKVAAIEDAPEAGQGDSQARETGAKTGTGSQKVVRIDLTATVADETVMAKAQVRVLLEN